MRGATYIHDTDIARALYQKYLEDVELSRDEKIRNFDDLPRKRKKQLILAARVVSYGLSFPAGPVYMVYD